MENKFPAENTWNLQKCLKHGKKMYWDCRGQCVGWVVCIEFDLTLIWVCLLILAAHILAALIVIILKRMGRTKENLSWDRGKTGNLKMKFV